MADELFLRCIKKYISQDGSRLMVFTTFHYFPYNSGYEAYEYEPVSVQYVVLSPRGPWSATFPNRCSICSLNKIRQKANVSDDLLISLLPYDKVSAFLLLMKARNSRLLKGGPIRLS